MGKCWNTRQGVINLKDVSEIILPVGYSWEYIEFLTETNLELITNFLNKNYNSKNSKYNIIFTKQSIKDYFSSSEIYSIITIKHKNEIIGLITGKLINMCYKNQIIDLYEINHLCLNYKYRSSNYVAILIKEIGRQAILKEIYYGIYITMDKHKTSFLKSNYYYSYVNIDKLLECEFINIPSIIKKKQEYINTKSININTETKYTISLFYDKKDIINQELSKPILNKLNEYNNKNYIIRKVLKDKDIYSDTVKSFIIKNINGDKILGFFTIYTQDIKYKNNQINTGHLYYYFVNEKENISEIFKELIIYIKKNNIYDLIIIDDTGKNKDIINNKECKIIDTNDTFYTYYYTYNFNIMIKNEEMCMKLLS